MVDTKSKWENEVVLSQLPDQSTTLWVISTSDPRLRGALPRGESRTAAIELRSMTSSAPASNVGGTVGPSL
jgi:hypothetical protein